MANKFSITLEELNKIGYYFLKPKDKDKFLKKVNDEFVYMLGKTLADRISLSDYQNLLALPSKKIKAYLRQENFDFEGFVLEVRENFLNELKEEREGILIQGIETKTFE